MAIVVKNNVSHLGRAVKRAGLEINGGKKLLAGIAALSVVALTPGQVFAQESDVQGGDAQDLAMEVVVVTARHREENLKDVPISLTVVNGDYIKQLGARTLEDIQDVVPNFIMSDGPRPEITIRGRKNSTSTIGVESGVGVYVNGVYTSRVGTNIDLMEVEQVEVLRGPQGTLYGKNTVTGAINIRIKKPGEEFKGGIATSIGNYGRQDIRGFVEGGFSDTLAARLSISQLEWDGYEYNVFTEEARGGNDSLSGQLQFNWAPTDALSLEMVLDAREVDSLQEMIRILSGQTADDQAANLEKIIELAGITTPLPQGRIDKGSENSDPRLQTNSKGASLTAEYVLNNDYVLTSISSWRDTDGEITNQDDDFLPTFMLNLGGFEDREAVTQEFRITSPGGQRIDWLAGLYYDSQDMSSELTLDVSDIGVASDTGALEFYGVEVTSGGNPATVETESIAVYGSLDFHVTDALTITVGARYTEENKDATFQQTFGGTCITGASDRASGVTPILVSLLQAGIALPGYNTACLFPSYDLGDLSFDTDSFDPAMSIGYIFSDEVSVYYKVSTGYKSGGFNIDLFRPEDDSIDEGLLAGLGLFSPDLRTEIPHTLTFDDETVLSHEIGVKTSFLDNHLVINFAAFYSEYEDMQEKVTIDGSRIVANVAEAEVQGYEVDMTWAINANWFLIGSYGYVETEYTDFPIIDDDGELSNRRGQEFGPAPWTASFSGEYASAITDLGSFRTRLAYTQTDGRPENFDGRITWASPEGAFSLVLWADNILDERDRGFGTEERFGLEYGIVGGRQPRTTGVDLSYKF